MLSRQRPRQHLPARLRLRPRAGVRAEESGQRAPLGPPVPPPVATRREVHCGWDGDFYDDEIALAVPGELIEAVVQDASGAAR